MRRAIVGLLVAGLCLCWGAFMQAQGIVYTPPSLLITGGTMTGPIILPDGTAAAPGVGFTSATNTGFYWSGSTIAVSLAGTGRYIFSTAAFYPLLTDSKTLGSTAALWSNAYVSRSIEGSKSKAVVDNTATAFVRLTVADDDYEGCGFVWTAFAEDADTDARQTRTGRTHVAVLNNSGTEACVFSTGDEAVGVTAGTFTCTFDCAAGTNTVDLRATCNTSLDAAAETLTFEYRLDCPSTIATLTPQ